MADLILCADDFALSPGTSAAIAELAAAGQINAVSCMAAAADWAQDARLLLPLSTPVAVGLHLVLTADAALVTAEDCVLPDPVSIDRLTWQAVTGRLPGDAIERTVERQFAAFAAAMGRPPAFVDGHQHSHVLPGIRQIVMRATARHAPQAWLRNCADRPAAMLRRRYRARAFASAAWSAGFREAAERYGLDTNDSFAGHYDFSGDFAALFQTFLRRPGRRHLVMCHPGADDRAGDTIGQARQREFAALRSLSVSALTTQAGLEF